MNPLSRHCLRVLGELEEMMHNISADDFYRSSNVLGGASIGQHVRHTLEFFQCLEKGLPDGTVDYDSRVRDEQIETDKTTALLALDRIRSFVERNIDDKPLTLWAGYDMQVDERVTMETTFFRELAYNLEHAVHHMAILKIGIASDVQLPKHFGTAASTVRYRAGR